MTAVLVTSVYSGISFVVESDQWTEAEAAAWAENVTTPTPRGDDPDPDVRGQMERDGALRLTAVVTKVEQ